MRELALKLVGANARLNALAIVTAAALLVLGVWMYLGVKASLQDIRGSGLGSVLDAEVEALDVWVGDRNKALALWAADAEVRRQVQVLLDLAHRTRASPDELWSDPAIGRLYLGVSDGLAAVPQA